MLALCGCLQHAPVRFQVLDVDSAQPIFNAGISGYTFWDPITRSNEFATENLLQAIWMNATGQSEAFEGKTDANGVALIKLPYRENGVHVDAYAKGYLNTDGRGGEKSFGLAAVEVKAAAADAQPFKIYFRKGPLAKVIIVVPVGYRGPVLLRDHGTIEHEPERRVFKIDADVAGVTDVPSSPPILRPQNVAYLDAEWSDGQRLRRPEALNVLRTGGTSRLPDDEIAWRPIEEGAYAFAVYFVGTMADARQYAADHGLVNDGNHSALRRLFYAPPIVSPTSSSTP